MKVKFIIPGKCVAKGRPRSTWRNGRVITYTPPATREYAELARTIAQNEYRKLKVEPIPYPEPVKMTIVFTINRKVTGIPDIINLGSQICDVLQGDRKHSPIAYDNDSQIVELHLYKVKGKYAMTEVTVETIK